VASLALPRKARRLVFWSMDLNPDEAIAAGWLQPNSFIARMLSRMLLHSLHRADSVIALDRFMKERIAAKGVDSRKILVIPPWSLDDRIGFDPAGRDEFRSFHKISNKFVVMYSGNHSPCHPLETLLGAAERLVDNDDVVFCFVGGGSEFAKVKERVRQRSLQNVLCLPYQPIGKLAGSLSAADLHVVVMGDQYVGIVHPCKIYNVLAVGRPFLYIGPSESHVTDIIREHKAYVASHGDVEGVVANILLARNNGRDGSCCDGDKGTMFSKTSIVPRVISAVEQEHATFA
jgi:colanic acid biosynthesis glycosyl transferase WcaI